MLIRRGRPQSTMATAQVLFHRFFYVSSMLSFSINVRRAFRIPYRLLTRLGVGYRRGSALPRHEAL